jgi:predicted ABC-class ATPase
MTRLRPASELRSILHRIDGLGYKAYKEIEGRYELEGFVLSIDHVQGDPFAEPSRVRLFVPERTAQFPERLWANRSCRIGLADFLTRAVAETLRRAATRVRGSGTSGLILIDAPGQEVLERTSVIVHKGDLEVRLKVGLPAAGRTVLGKAAAEILLGQLPELIERALRYRAHASSEVERHVAANEDQDFLREKLKELGLVAFVANGSLLPRRSGVDDRPMPRERAVLFQSPPSMEVEIELPHAGPVRGMGIPSGVTLIVGGGYHGKSTLLRAIERGVYNHIPGDGRELVVTDPTAVKIRAEDGRRIEKVNISPFIGRLPFGKDTRSFSTDDASGSTSQAANIIEALEVGARVLLMDEDTCATNFMIRDHRMQELVAKEKEPITPFLDKVRQLYGELGVSTILAIGGSGEYFDVADRVIMMDEYRPRDVTAQAKAIAAKYKAERKAEGGERFGEITPRRPLPESINPSKGKRDVKLKAADRDEILFGAEEIDLSAVEQIVSRSQTRAIGHALVALKTRYLNGRRTLLEALEALERDLDREGLDLLTPYPVGDLARPRRYEIAAAVNRLRTLEVLA